MGAAYFYHLTREGLAQALPKLITASQAKGWRVAIRGPSPVLDHLDAALWLGPEDGFLAHGRAGGAHDALQPVLLTEEQGAAANGATCLMSVGGAEVSIEEIAEMDRVCIVFDGQDGEAVQQARGQWKALTAGGAAAQYWSQESGRWQKKTESG